MATPYGAAAAILERIRVIHFHPYTVAMTSLALIFALETKPMENIPAMVLCLAGIFGGAITQCVTSNTRKMTKVQRIGELAAGAVFGMMAFAYFGSVSGESLVAASFLGGGGSTAWVLGVNKYNRWLLGNQQDGGKDG